PPADDPAVPPDGGPDVAECVEEGGLVVAEVPVASLPAHRGRVEGGQEGGDRTSRWGRVEIIGEDDAGLAVEDDVDGVEGGECRARVTERPACPPGDVGLGGRTERAKPALDQGGTRGGWIERGDAVGEPGGRRLPRVLA